MLGQITMRIILTLLTLFITFASCKDENENIIGKYETANYSKIERYIKAINYRGVSMGCSLELKSDSTFVYQTCGIISSGNWQKERDSIILREEIIRWRNDSLNEFGFNGEHPKPIGHISFYLDGNDLINVQIDQATENKKGKYYSRLEKQKIENN